MSTLRKGAGALLLLALTLTCSSLLQQARAQNRTTKIVKNWINWNGLFKEKIDSAQRQKTLERIKSEIAAFSKKPVEGIEPVKGKLTSYLQKTAKKNNTGNPVIVNIRINFCTCNDPMVFNVTSDIKVDSTGDSQPSTTPPPSKIVVKGDPLSMLTRNEPVNLLDVMLSSPLEGGTPLNYSDPFKFSENTALAIIDTGIDSTLLAEGVRNGLFWNGPQASKNFLIGANPANYMDDYPSRHGTSVAAIAMNAFNESSGKTMLPKLMVLKALDASGAGSSFEVCCALCYAYENHATLVNMSFAYTGLEDLLLDHYMAKFKRDSIPLVVAAGNSDDLRDTVMVCSETLNSNNEIRPGKMVYPAALSSEPNRYSVITVTGFSKPGIPCYYQNYSEHYVTMGVMNATSGEHCCTYTVPFLRPDLVLEGTSFATPVVSGTLAHKISVQGKRANSAGYLSLMNVLNAPPGTQRVTRGNQYITH